MKYDIGDQFINDIDGLVITIVGVQGREYVVDWEDGFPNAVSESHLDEYYTMVEKQAATNEVGTRP